MSWRACGICGLTSSRIALPLTIDCPNLSPKPARDWAAALSVRFSFTGSTFSAMEVTVWNSVLISVVTAVAQMLASFFVPQSIFLDGSR
jgi:hypothetical protein